MPAMRIRSLILLALVAGCGDDGGADVHDAARHDAPAEAPDAEVPDAEVPDAEVPDAEAPDAGIPDAEIPDGEPPTGCDPVAQTGCGVGLKCTWVNIDDTSGVIDCVPNGSVVTAGECTMGPDGAATGFDNCLAGDYCIGGICQEICTVSPDSCAATSVCSRYSGVFEGAFPEMGACDFLCDPVDQTRTVDGAAACGSPVPATPNRGCYGVFDFAFRCAPVPAMVMADPLLYDHGDTAYGPGTGSAYLNGCAPGYLPTIRSSFDVDAPVLCVAACTPGPTSLEDPANANGLVGSGHTCADRGAPGPTWECRYFWIFETGVPPLHPDGVGFCWDPDDYIADWDNDLDTPDTAAPRCSTIATADQTGMGCAPY